MLPALQPVTIRLLIVDDHQLFAEGIRFLIEHRAGYVVVGILHRGQEVIPFLEQNPVDVLLLDIDLPDTSGFELAKAICVPHPNTRILALSMLSDTQSINHMMEAGAAGYCCKSVGREELFMAIQAVSEGRHHWPSTYFDQVKQEKFYAGRALLTNREHEIIRLITDGISTRTIASALFLSARTVETHRKNIYRKLGVHTNVELTLHARKMRLI